MTRRVAQAVAAALATGLVPLALRGGDATLTAVGCFFLLIVLAAGSLFGFPEALVAALAATLQYNFFFIPPVGAFAIQDPRNWAALLTFLVTAAVAGHLSAAARSGAAAAEQRRLEITRLFALSRAGLLADPAHAAPRLERALVAIFGFQDARIEMAGRPAPAGDWQRWPLRVGVAAELGALHVQGAPLPGETADAVAGLVAVALERARVVQESGRLQALRESDALKAALLDSVTHDMRTPLTSIKAAVTTLSRGVRAAADPVARDLLAVIDEECDGLNQAIQNLVDMARIESGALRPTLRPQPLAPVVEHAIARARLAPERVRLEVEPDLPEVVADGGLLSQAVGQLIANAAAYAPPATPIEVRLRARAGEVVAEIVDEGPGIPPEFRQRIFEKFYRDPAARRVRPEGLGMGLAIARGIIEAHRGSIAVAAEPGRGARFWFALPAVPARAPAAPGTYVAHPGD